MAHRGPLTVLSKLSVRLTNVRFLRCDTVSVAVQTVLLPSPLRLSRQEESRVTQERLFELIDSPRNALALAAVSLSPRGAKSLNASIRTSRDHPQDSKISIIERV